MLFYLIYIFFLWQMCTIFLTKLIYKNINKTCVLTNVPSMQTPYIFFLTAGWWLYLFVFLDTPDEYYIVFLLGIFSSHLLFNFKLLDNKTFNIIYIAITIIFLFLFYDSKSAFIILSNTFFAGCLIQVFGFFYEVFKNFFLK